MRVTLNIRTLQRNTYTLRSQHFEGLRIAMDRRGEWGRFDPHLTSDYDAGAEVLTEFTIVAAPEIILPDWTRRAEADEAHAQAWDAMLAALTAHEETHRDIFDSAVQRFRRRMLRPRSMPRTDFEAAWEAFTADLEDEQERYDRTSRHGQREGVVLDDPPSP